MIVEEPNYLCPECFEGIHVRIEVEFDIKTAAHELLEEYKGWRVSAGDAIILEEAIRKCLVDELGVPAGRI